jgi:hypothetical protein
LETPCSPKVVIAIQKIAAHNALIYEGVFQHTPRNSMRTFAEIGQAFALPYPALFDEVGTRLKHEYLVRPSSLHLSEDQKTENVARKKMFLEDALTDAGRGKKYLGVIPPALLPQFMTTQLTPHQRTSLSETQFGRTQQLYHGGTVHNVSGAIQHLKSNVIGFFVSAPLDWTMAANIDGDLSKESTVDIAMSGTSIKDEQVRRS